MTLKVAVIEDNPQIREVISLCFKLRWPEVSVVSAPDGEEGVKLVETESPDAVILDIGLPDMDGFEVLARIRHFSSVPVIILTVRSDEADEFAGLELGADDYIVKPFDHRELIARVKKVLSRIQLVAHQ
ncbi:MAG: response regulator [Dehalococcoidia bacterium]|nr:response regulator [Dehalococcoidia bacterium]